MLETTEGRACQDTKRKRLNKGRLLSGDSRGRVLSGHGKKETEGGALTNWRQQREGLVRTRKESDRKRGTHFLEMAEGDLSGHRKKAIQQAALTFWRPQREGLVRTQEENDQARALTSWRWQREGPVRI